MVGRIGGFIVGGEEIRGKLFTAGRRLSRGELRSVGKPLWSSRPCGRHVSLNLVAIATRRGIDFPKGTDELTARRVNPQIRFALLD